MADFREEEPAPAPDAPSLELGGHSVHGVNMHHNTSPEQDLRMQSQVSQDLRTQLQVNQDLRMQSQVSQDLRTQMQVNQDLRMQLQKIEELEEGLKTSREELESEKAAREEAWSKVSALELEINAARRDLDYERRRLRAARESIMLRETQLRAFYSTTEEISNLFAKQQEQLKLMQRTLGDEENYENTSVGINTTDGGTNGNLSPKNRSDKAGSFSNHGFKRKRTEASNDVDSVTEKHECSSRSQEDGENTQEVEFKGTEDSVKGAFGSDICCGTEPLEGDPIETKRVPETESLGIDCERNIDLNKCSTLAGDTMQLDDEDLVEGKENRDPEKENEDTVQETCGGSNSNNQDHRREMEDTEPGSTIRTSDLLASEVAGSLACSTVPSVHGENESLTSRNGKEVTAPSTLHDSVGFVAESQNTHSSKKAAREEAWSKVSALELEINAARRDLDYERRRLRAARESIMLRETQLRAFYSTTEEISNLFVKQQEQLKLMQRTLGDEENYENTSVGINTADGGTNGNLSPKNRSDKAVSFSNHGFKRERTEASNDVDSVTEKHECSSRSQEEGENTQEVEFKGTEDCVKGDPIETERVPETESLGIDCERNIDLNKCSTLAGDTMQLDDEDLVEGKENRDPEKENEDTVQETCGGSNSNNQDHRREMEDTEPGSTIRTSDLLASEVAGSLACSNVPSVHGENESLTSRNGKEVTAPSTLHDSVGFVAESQNTHSSKKAAREEAWSKVSALELEINAARRDLDYERRRLRAARESIMLRETQLRAFYSTTEEISNLFVKQQEQLKLMQRTLGDEENYENTSVGINTADGGTNGNLSPKNRSDKAVSFSNHGFKRERTEASNDVDSVTEKHECSSRSQEEGENTQEVEFKGTEDCVKGDPIETERVPETESLGIDCERNIDLNKCSTLAGDTMQLDDEDLVEGKENRDPEKENEDTVQETCGGSNSNNQDHRREMEDTEPGSTIRTSDLLASEVAGSLACSTVPSVHGENESLTSCNGKEVTAPSTLHDSVGFVAESQNTHSSKKAAREEAWSKVSALELEINAARRDLDYERRRLRAARESIMLRETQLRAFYSTTEEISNLFAKQQEQLKLMQRTLGDEENYENTSVGINTTDGGTNGNLSPKNRSDKAGSFSNHGFKRKRTEASNDVDSVTEKHECSSRSQEDGENTQEVEFKGTEDSVKGAFGSDICCGTEPLEGDPIETKRVPETESLGIDCERNIDLNKCSTLAGDTMQLDDEDLVEGKENRDPEKENEDTVQETCGGSNSNNQDHQREMEDTEPGSTIRTSDLLASEVAGSLACSTVPSVHGENESLTSRNGKEVTAPLTLHDSVGFVDENKAPLKVAPVSDSDTETQSDQGDAMEKDDSHE